jgi:DMATS type aromatic prenyltransferase
LGANADTVLATFQKLVGPWGDRPPSNPHWHSEISDDNTPVEFSLTLEGEHAEVRALFEPQGAEPTVASYRSAALKMHDRLERDFGANLSRFHLVKDLFAPPGMRGPFAIWNAVVFKPGQRDAFKTYFNPQASGPAQAAAVVDEALCRLGFPTAWSQLSNTAASRGPLLDELKYFALDLSDAEEARVKVYVRHHGASPDDLERACSAAEGYVPGEALGFASAVTNGRSQFDERAAFTCAAFVQGTDQPVATTLYVPVCAYSANDLEVRRRVGAYLSKLGLSPEAYYRIVDGYADRDLDAGVGMQSWVALRRYRGRLRLTVYLGTEANCVYAPDSVPAATEDRLGVEDIAALLTRLEDHSLVHHPLLVRATKHGSIHEVASVTFQALWHGATRHRDRWVEATPFQTLPSLSADLVKNINASLQRSTVAMDSKSDVGGAAVALAATLERLSLKNTTAGRTVALLATERCLAQVVGMFLRQIAPVDIATELDESTRTLVAALNASSETHAKPSRHELAVGFQVHQAFWQFLAELQRQR